MGRLVLTSLSGAELLELYLNDAIECCDFDSEDEETLYDAIVQLTQHVKGTFDDIRAHLAKENLNTYRMQLFHGTETVATDYDIARIALEGLFEVPGTREYDCYDVHLRLVFMSVYDDEAERQKLVDSVHRMDTATVEEVLKAGQDPNCVDDSGRTPAMIAAAYGYTDVLHLLWLAAADFRKVHEETQRTVLHFAAEVKDPRTAAFLLDKGDVDFMKRDRDNLLAFDVAMVKGDDRMKTIFREGLHAYVWETEIEPGGRYLEDDYYLHPKVNGLK